MSEVGFGGPERSSADLAVEMKEILGDKAQRYAAIDKEIRDRRDNSDRINQQRRQTYHEEFIDTPAKELLWQAESLPSKFLTPDYKYYGEKFSNIARTDLVLAYAEVAPDEGYRLLQSMPVSNAKVEALARFGRLTDDCFIDQARELAIENNYPALRWEILSQVAAITGDQESSRLALEVLLHHQARRSGGNDPYFARHLLTVAATGNKPALLMAKQVVLREAVWNKDLWSESVAQAAFIEDSIQKQGISVIVPLDDNQEKIYASLSKNWEDLLLDSRDQVIPILEQGIELPGRRGCFEAALEIIQPQVSKCSSLITEQEYYGYIKTRLSDYQTSLTNNPQALHTLVDSAYKVSEQVRPKDMVKKEFADALKYRNHDILEWQVVMNREYTIDVLKEDQSYDLNNLLPQVNLLCLNRAASRAAVELASS